MQQRKVDILFVIDDSGSMGEEQAALAANFSALIEELEATEVVADIGGFVGHLCHDHDIPGLVGLAKGSDGFGQLVAEDEDEARHQGISLPA